MGYNVPLGYQADGRTLKIEPEEVLFTPTPSPQVKELGGGTAACYQRDSISRGESFCGKQHYVLLQSQMFECDFPIPFLLLLLRRQM